MFMKLARHFGVRLARNLLFWLRLNANLRFILRLASWCAILALAAILTAGNLAAIAQVVLILIVFVTLASLVCAMLPNVRMVRISITSWLRGFKGFVLPSFLIYQPIKFQSLCPFNYLSPPKRRARCLFASAMSAGTSCSMRHHCVTGSSAARRWICPFVRPLASIFSRITSRHRPSRP